MTTKASTKEMRRGTRVAPVESVWLTAPEAAHYLSVEPRTLLMWARQGKVRGYAPLRHYAGDMALPS